MIAISFYPDSDYLDFKTAVVDYDAIWNSDGVQMVRELEAVTGLSFVETSINAVVGDFVSRSHPLTLRHDTPHDRKKSTLLHELGHRLLYKKRAVAPADSLVNHQHLYLCLHQVLVNLYGSDFTQETVEWESALSPIYKEAWAWVLQIPSTDRLDKFQEIMNT